MISPWQPCRLLHRAVSRDAFEVSKMHHSVESVTMIYQEIGP